ncbi:PJA2 ligase, partial [Turnix velox]|nr:PJA2 ligase [Turnix velox]
MGQEAGKSAWPKSAGGNQPITGRRYGRRHAYVTFRPSFNNRDTDEHQYEDCERLEWVDVQEESSLYSNPLVQVSSYLLDEPLLENTGTGEPICQSISSRIFQAHVSPFSLFSNGFEGNRISGNFVNPYENSENLAEYPSGGHNDLNGQNGIAFVNIDSYEPDSSDGEEDDAQNEFSLSREAEGILQGTMDNMFLELEKGMESLNDLQSRLFALSVSRECCEEAGPVPLMRYFNIDSGLTCQNWMLKSSAEDQTRMRSNLSGANHETQKIRNTVDVGVGTPVDIVSELNVSVRRIDQGNSPELVVRPKIRKPSIANQLERERLLPNDNEEESDFQRGNDVNEIQQGYAERNLRSSDKISTRMLFDSREYEGHMKNKEMVLMKNTAAQEQKKLPDNYTVWDDFEVCSTYSFMSHNDEDSSEWSDGEWFTTVPAYITATEKAQSSSDESWETAPGREECEPEVQSSSSSGTEEENTDIICFQGGEQTFLEEGEIPWLQYQEEVESSSDEENYPVSDFVHPGFFLMDGNNNFEDDSTVSEDLDVEWRQFEFGDGLGFAEAIPHMGPQLLAFISLDGNSQQALESALEHLELLGFVIERAHPPAPKEAIDSLPHIVATDDHEAISQELCCTVCCSEYVKDEIITELPCHHLFHKLCITLWLQTSGTCPVCRRVLAPVPPVLAPVPPEVADAADSSPSD